MLVHAGMTVTFIRESECNKACYNNQLWNKNRNVTILSDGCLSRPESSRSAKAGRDSIDSMMRF